MFCVLKYVKSDNSEDLGTGEWIIFKSILRKQNGDLCTGCIWLMIGTNGVLMWKWQWTSGCNKRWGIYSLSEWPLAFQTAFSSVGLVMSTLINFNFQLTIKLSLVKTVLFFREQCFPYFKYLHTSLGSCPYQHTTTTTPTAPVVLESVSSQAVEPHYD